VTTDSARREGVRGTPPGRPRKVVAALHQGDPGGPLRSLKPVLARLATDGEVVAVLPDEGGAVEELRGVARVEILGHRALVLPRGARALATLLPRLVAEVRGFRALLRRERPDLVLIVTTTLTTLNLAARLERVPTVLYAAELYRHGSRGDALRIRLGPRLLRVNAALATVTVPCSQAVGALLAPRTPQVVVYPAIDPAVARGDAEGFRRKHGIAATGPCLATLGNIARGRGQDVAIRALADLRRDRPGAQLVIAGVPHPRPTDHAFAAELEELAEELGVRDAVHLCGFARPGDVFAVADVVVNPARFAETFGIVAMEALVSGRPVVSTDVGAVPEVLEDGRHALLVPSDHPEALAAAVRRLLDDPALALRLVEQGREHVLSSFSAERQLPRFDRAIAMALAAGAPASGRSPTG
jgi:glycosyltransferase involved in cell wall biosynthesis